MSGLVQKLKASIIVQLGLSYIFLTSGLIINFLQLLTLFIWPFDKLLYRKLNCYLAYCFYSSLLLIIILYNNW